MIQLTPTKINIEDNTFTLKVAFDLSFIRYLIEQYDYSIDKEIEIRFGKLDLCFYVIFDNSDTDFLLEGFDEDYAYFNLVHFLKAYFDNTEKEIYEFETEIQKYNMLTFFQYCDNLKQRQVM